MHKKNAYSLTTCTEAEDKHIFSLRTERNMGWEGEDELGAIGGKGRGGNHPLTFVMDVGRESKW